LISTLGMIDSFMTTMERNDREILREHPDRLVVALKTFVNPAGPEVARIASVPTVGGVQPVLRFGGTLSRSSGESFEVIVDAIDFGNALWKPTLNPGGDATGGLVIAQEAAADLHVGPGDTVLLQHPARRAYGLTVVETPIQVAAVHPSPFRFNAYIDRSQLPSLELPDVSNVVYAVPSVGSSTADVQQSLFGLAPVASVQPVAATSEVVKDSLEEFVAVFRVLEAFMMALAMLIAYNATSINAEERQREHATLFAFGVPPRRVLRIEIVEAVMIGVIGTALGLLGGRAVLGWVAEELIGSTMPEMGMEVAISIGTIVAAFTLGAGHCRRRRCSAVHRTTAATDEHHRRFARRRMNPVDSVTARLQSRGCR
jgi:putative ABC transport system permease protein